MFDPLTALGIASNIIQIVQFTSDLVAKSQEYYSSADGALVEQLELEAITVTLQALSRNLVVPGNALRFGKSKTEEQLRSLCTGCTEVANELLATIQTLKAGRSHNKWNSFRQALNSVWKESKIKKIELRLERYRRQIDTTLLMSIRDSIDHLPDSQRQSEHVSRFILRPGEHGTKQWQTALVDEVHHSDWKHQAEKDMMHFSAILSASAKEDRDALVKLHILERLRFNSMQDRATCIPKAHERTFNWIFEDSICPINADNSSSSATNSITTTKPSSDNSTVHPSSSNFAQWLQGDSKIYWITGKPGSGKSTLMKYLQDDPRTLRLLKTWVGEAPLTTAGHFFWNSGDSMQMSQLGLLQTLLYNAIEYHVDVIPKVFPRRWKSYQDFGADLRGWTMNELIEAFQILVSDESTKFFFFIDGLDEYNGNRGELATFIIDLVGSRKNVKFCVASRPWLVFEDAFRSLPSLRVEDLTAPDIREYVASRLNDSQMFIRLNALDHSEAARLIGEVVSKASGVFLWVTLVVNSLIDGLRDGDTITDLHERLERLPSGLGSLFDKMLRSLEPNHIEQASIYFQCVRAAKTPMTLILLSYAEEGLDNAISSEIKSATGHEQDFRAETMRRRLSSRCKGLLEAPKKLNRLQDARVQYLHRTVKDYIYEEKLWEFVVSGGKGSFNPDVALSAAWLRTIKTLPASSFETHNTFWLSQKSCADYSIRFEKTCIEAHIKLLDELFRVGSKIFDTSGEDENTWMKNNGPLTSPWIDPQRELQSLPGATCALGYSYSYPLHTYLVHKLKTGSSLDIQVEGRSLLLAASQKGDYNLVKVLFNLGANPNACDNAETIQTTWKRYLLELSPLRGTGAIEMAAVIIKLYLDHGADIRMTVEKQTVADFIKSGLRNPREIDGCLQHLAICKKAANTGKVQGDREKQRQRPARVMQDMEPKRVEEALVDVNELDHKTIGALDNVHEPSSKRSTNIRSLFRGMRSIFKRRRIEV